MSGTAASIPLQFRPTEQIDLGRSLANAQQMMANQQAWEQTKRQNALLSIFKDPSSIDQTGNPTAETIQKVMAVDPNTGVALRRNSMIAQEQELRGQIAKSDLTAKRMDLIAENYAPVMEGYETALRNGTSVDKATQDAQAALVDVNQRMAKTGMFSPDELKNQPQTFDPIKLRNLVAVSSGWQNYQKELLQTQRQKDLEKHYGAMGAQQMSLKDGRAVTWHPNAADPSMEYTFANTGERVPPELLNQLAKVPGGAGGQKDQIMRSVMADINADPEWSKRTDGERYLEAMRRMKLAGQGGSLADDPKGLKVAAEMFVKKGSMPVGFRNKADQDAIMRYLGDHGITAGDVIEASSTTTADAGSLKKITSQFDAISGYEKGVEGEFGLVQKYMPKTAEPLDNQLLTEWVRTGSVKMGNVRNAQFYAALTSALDEYAKVLSGGTGSAVASTDASRRQALSIISPGATTDQINGLLRTMKEGMDLKRAGYQSQIEDIRGRLHASGMPGEQGGQTGGQKQGQGGGAGGTQQAAATPQERDIAYLRSNPQAAALFDKRFGPGASAKILQPQSQPTAPAQPQTQPGQQGFGPLAPVPGAPTVAPTAPGAPTGESQPANLARRTEVATPAPGMAGPRAIPAEGIPVPPQYANLPDGQTFGKGKYIKRGGRIYLNQGGKSGVDETTEIMRAREAIKMGAPRDKVEERLRGAGIDPSKL